MKKLLRYTLLIFTVSTLSVASGMAVFAGQEGISSLHLDTVTTVRTQESVESAHRSTRSTQGGDRSLRSFFSSWFSQPVRSAPAHVQSDKLLSNVKVFPHSSGESLNLSFRLNKRSDVSIKIMDALGNELMTLFSETLDSGIHNQSLEIQQKLNAGFYFVRVSAGGETVVKRISIL